MDLVLNALRRKLEQEDDPDKVAAYESRIADLEAEEDSDDDGDDLAGLTKADLLDLAEDRGLDVTAANKKQEIIDALQES